MIGRRTRTSRRHHYLKLGRFLIYSAAMKRPMTKAPEDRLPDPIVAEPAARHRTQAVIIGEGPGAITVGGGAPIMVQSMTNTDTADVASTVAQISALAQAGSEVVRITVDRDEAAAAVPHIREQLDKKGVHTPLVGDFHYIGHKLLADHPACAQALAKYRINPGNVGFKDKKTSNLAQLLSSPLNIIKLFALALIGVRLIRNS